MSRILHSYEWWMRPIAVCATSLQAGGTLLLEPMRIIAVFIFCQFRARAVLFESLAIIYLHRAGRAMKLTTRQTLKETV